MASRITVFKIGVGAVVMKGDQVLMVKRNFPPWAGDWSIIQGLVEPGELIDEAVKREVREETGVEVEVEGVIAMREPARKMLGKFLGERRVLTRTDTELWRSLEYIRQQVLYA